ncbi:hypothetical protein EV201_0633 [Ancylomarina subtilis]|uniref:Uncharacterized protein n=1 Tax=Ancylomarina subtilis TaxID=1639035 RepID=A0A4Q7VIW2_9BACT|nr:hypothetical protein EV201_0633 [Ancylomarina subtilis]
MQNHDLLFRIEDWGSVGNVGFVLEGNSDRSKKTLSGFWHPMFPMNPMSYLGWKTNISASQSTRYKLALSGLDLCIFFILLYYL